MSTQLHKVYSRTASWFSRKEVIRIYIFCKSQANITRADRIMFYTDREKLLKNTLIFRPVLASVGAQARCDFIKGNASLFLACLRNSSLHIGEVALFNNRWWSYTLPHQMVWRSSTHKWGKELNQLNTIQIWEGSFTLCDPYFVQSALSGEKNRNEHLKNVHIAHQRYLCPKYLWRNGKNLNLARHFI